MSAPPFVHLHCHSHYSLLDGASPIKGLVARAKELGMNALAITDHGNLYGAIEFYKTCKDAGINPVLGYEAYVAPGSRFDKSGATSSKEAAYHLTLLAQNATGFRNLVKLASRAFLEGMYHKPRIDRELLASHHDGIICLSGCVSGEFSRALLANSAGFSHKAGNGIAGPNGSSASSPNVEAQIAAAREIAAWFHGVFGDRYFIEIQDNGLEIQRLAKEAAVEVARRMGLPTVVTSDAHYVRQEDAVAQDVLLCINTGKFRTDVNRMRMEGDQFFLRSAEEMFAALPDQEEALRRSQEIANSVDIDLELGKRHFPAFNAPEQKNSNDYLRELCLAGLQERYAARPHRWANDDPAAGNLSQEVHDRLDRELAVIDKLGFNDYFLIVWDFVRFAGERGIPCTARGSGVGSLVCYALHLSHVCPLDYDLLFERFLDESRLEAPDIDIDFCKERRGEVIQYVKDKYGDSHVAQIGTFGTLAARAAIRDVGRTLSMPIPRVDAVVALVPDQLGITLNKALETSDDLRKVYDSDAEVRELIDLARKIEGLARNVGTHAAAVVIADRPVDEFVPLQTVKGKTEVITQWAMGDVEAAGLLKMDFLGLRNLTILARSVALIEQSHKAGDGVAGLKIDPYSFPLDDKETFALLCRGETKGIFQLESGGIRDLLQRMKPDHFRDIIATNALYRPGPLEGGMVDQYIEVKHGRKQAEYPHEVTVDILAETHGVMVYQEQVMRIINRLGDIALSNAYTCIKAISKKKLPIIARYREEFIAGAKAKGVGEKQANELFGQIEKFAGYGFNKCLIGDTEIVNADSGERLTVQQLFENSRPMHIHALRDDGKIVKKQVTDVVWNGRKPVYCLKTKLGRVITATGNHPLRTFEGWTHVEHLRPGDRIASPRRLEVTGDRSWKDFEVITLAGLISEGNTCHPTCLYFYNNDAALVDDFVSAVEQFPNTKARVDVRRGPRREVCVSTGADARWRPGDGSARPAVAAGVRCGAFLWAKQLGILEKRAASKALPADVFRLHEPQVELFLGRLWSGDGFVGARGQMPFYATSSLQLAGDVQLLLLRLGIVSRITTKLLRYRYKGVLRERPAYTVHLLGDDSVRTFVDRVGPYMIGRDQQLAAYREYLSSVARATSKDTVPPAVRALVDQERRAAGLGWRELEAQSGVSMREFAARSQRKQGFRRATIARLAIFFESQRLREIAESDVYWDRIESIEPAGVADVYDLTVEHEHNFVADGLVVHNSHSTAYALIAYMTAYLKAHYPVEFMAALLSCDIPGRNFKSKDALVEHLEDCRRMNIDVLPPDVNACDPDFKVAAGRIHFGLSAVKACGAGAAEAILAARQKGGPFASIFDFCERVDAQECNRATIEALIKAGAFDALGGHRAAVMAVLDRALQSGAAAAADRRSGQKGLFGDDEPEIAAASSALPDLPPWSEKEKLAAEKEVLGYYLSSHPLAEFEPTLRLFCANSSKSLASMAHRDEVMLGGMLASIKFSHTKNPRPGSTNTRYAMWDLEDLDGHVRCIMWPEQFAQHGELVKADAILALRGKIDRRPGAEEVNIIVDELIPLADLPSRFSSGVVVRVREQEHGERGLEQLREILRGYPGSKKFRLCLDLAAGGKVWLDSSSLRVDATSELRRRVEDLLGPGSFSLQAAPPRPSGSAGNRSRREPARA